MFHLISAVVCIVVVVVAAAKLVLFHNQNRCYDNPISANLSRSLQLAGYLASQTTSRWQTWPHHRSHRFIEFIGSHIGMCVFVRDPKRRVWLRESSLKNPSTYKDIWQVVSVSKKLYSSLAPMPSASLSKQVA